KAAKQGDANAQYYLGLCYNSGNGVPKDLKTAQELMKKAALGGNREAKKLRSSSKL
ncbi:MAG: SEL1-like repeat protein, partial [Lentisphaeraceae bacterium]|nr:SEL1-like repeat protein [Lentisphaeraceae bacterium]